AIAAKAADPVTSRADAPMSDALSIWPRCPPLVSTRRSEPSMIASSKKANWLKSPSPPSCESSSFSQTPSFAKTESGSHFILDSHHRCYPYIVVRIACRRCTRKGSYRLARLAAKYGSEIPMMELLAHLAGDCAIWDARHPGAPRCGAYFVDLEFPAPPPDRPTEGMRRLRLVKDGGAQRRAAPKKRASASSRTSNGRQASPRIANPTARSAPTGAFGANAHIGNMAREDFLGCLSKAWIEKVGSSLRVLPRPRAKDTRAEVIKQAFSEVARHAPFSKRMRRVMGHADRSSRSMLLKAQADRFAVDLILDCERRPAAKIRVTVIGRAGAKPHGGPLSMPPPCAEPRRPAARFRALTPKALARRRET